MTQRDILYLTGNLGGGTGNHLVQVTNLLDQQRWKPAILSEARVSTRIEPRCGVKLFQALPAPFNRYPFIQLRRLFETIIHLRTRRPSIVHAYFFWPIIYARLLKMSGLVAHLVENREDEGFNWGRHEYALLKLTKNAPDKIICVSNAVRRVVLEREGLDPGKTIVIYNGVMPPAATTSLRMLVRERLGFKEEHKVVGMVANFNRPVKGVQYFVEAMPLIAGRCPEARFLILGKGSQEQELRDRARELGVEGKLVFAGFHYEMEPFYRAMDISVLTSLSEGLSITLLESMNYALPAVVTKVGGNPEVVVDGETGFLVPPQDPAAFSEKVIELIKDESRAVRFGEAGRKRVAAEFSLPLVVNKYQALYDEVLDKEEEGG